MESAQTQYRLLSVNNKPLRNEKRTSTYTKSYKQKTHPFEGQLPPKDSHNYSKKPTQKHKENAKHQNYVPKTSYYPVFRGTESQHQEAYMPRHQYYPQYYMPSPMGYPELLMPVYGYPYSYIDTTYSERKAADENSPQGVGYSGCPTVASEEDLNNLNGEECELKVVCNGNLIHAECYSEQGSDPSAKSAISLSDYEEFVLPLTGSEPKSEAISLPTFLLE